MSTGEYDIKFHTGRKGNSRHGHNAAALMHILSLAGVRAGSILDVGSSIGCLLEELSRLTGLQKKDITGIDFGNVVAAEFCNGVAELVLHDMNTGVAVVRPGGFDIVVCQEFVEHIDAAHEDNVIGTVAANVSPGGLVLWSAAHPGQRGRNHINMRPAEYWLAKLEGKGLKEDKGLTEAYRKFLIDTGDSHIFTYRDNGRVLRPQEKNGIMAHGQDEVNEGGRE